MSVVNDLGQNTGGTETCLHDGQISGNICDPIQARTLVLPRARVRNRWWNVNANDLRRK